MSDICVAYWSGTGNTEAMAQAIGAGITAAGKSADVVPMETISPADLKDQAVWVLGCPAMGAEELEDGTVEPFVSELEGFASGKKVAAQIVGGEGLICHGTPGADAIDECESLGREVAGL